MYHVFARRLLFIKIADRCGLNPADLIPLVASTLPLL